MWQKVLKFLVDYHKWLPTTSYLINGATIWRLLDLHEKHKDRTIRVKQIKQNKKQICSKNTELLSREFFNVSNHFQSALGKFEDINIRNEIKTSILLGTKNFTHRHIQYKRIPLTLKEKQHINKIIIIKIFQLSIQRLILWCQKYQRTNNFDKKEVILNSYHALSQMLDDHQEIFQLFNKQYDVKVCYDVFRGMKGVRQDDRKQKIYSKNRKLLDKYLDYRLNHDLGKFHKQVVNNTKVLNFLGN